MAGPLTSSDEELHPPGADAHWQESYYFNWADLEGDSFGLASIGYRIVERKADAVVVMMRGGCRELVYGASNKTVSGDPMAIRSAAGFRVGRLSFRMEEPLKRWHIELSGRDNIDLTWTALADAFDFAESGGAEVIAARHFEHPGVVTGRTRVGGREHNVDGFGTRDKSWGPRDWGNITGWDWISAQFGETLAFTATQAKSDRQLIQSGFVYRDGACTGIDHFEARYTWEREHVVCALELVITDINGRAYQFTARQSAHVPLFKSGMLIEETHATFDAVLGDQRIRGAGVIEHTWHAGFSGTLAWLPQLLPVVKDVLLSRIIR